MGPAGGVRGAWTSGALVTGVLWGVGVSGGIGCSSSVGGVMGPAGDVEGIGGQQGL